MVINIQMHQNTAAPVADYIESCIHLDLARYTEVILKIEVSLWSRRTGGEENVCHIAVFLAHNPNAPLVVEEVNRDSKAAIRACVYHAKKALNRQLKLLA